GTVDLSANDQAKTTATGRKRKSWTSLNNACVASRTYRFSLRSWRSLRLLRQSKVRHEKARELRPFAFFFMLEINEHLAARAGVSCDGICPPLDVVGCVPLVA